VALQRALLLEQPVGEALARRVPLPDELAVEDKFGLRLTTELPLGLTLIRGENESLEEPLDNGLARAVFVGLAEAEVDGVSVCDALAFAVDGALALPLPLVLRVTRADGNELCDALGLPLELPKIVALAVELRNALELRRGVTLIVMLAEMVAETDAERDPLGQGLELRDTSEDTLSVRVTATLPLTSPLEAPLEENDVETQADALEQKLVIALCDACTVSVTQEDELEVTLKVALTLRTELRL
jgi:hypothetical protein